MFSEDLQHAFADLSGDRNPIHVDAIAARRLLFGRPVVHGVHALLWALDEAVGGGRLAGPLRSVRAAFRQPIRVGETGVCEGRSDARIGGTVRVGDRLCLDFQCERGDNDVRAAAEIPDRAPARDTCVALPFEQAPTASGEIALTFAREAARRVFPRLLDVVPAEQMALLLGATHIVGMRCPGEHSLFAGLEMTFGCGTPHTPRVAFSVASADSRFSRLVIDLEGAGAKGTLTAFYRPPPTLQESMSDLAGKVQAGEFSNVRALVVGGSRGLGEVAAKLMAAGGAEVCVTYQIGRADAERVVADMRASGARATALPLDILQPAEKTVDALRALNGFTHVMYFATPRIEHQKEHVFSTALFATMCAYYVDGFLHVVEAVRREGEPLSVLYPSTVFVGDMSPDFPEYVAAKAAGEALCAVLEKKHPRMKIVRPRLPRVRTDQTAGLMAAHVDDPVDTLLPVLRSMAI